jgi:hypothetical protein
MTWKEDRNRLRDALREGMRKKTLKGLEATFLCVLVSHMRGKIHMRLFSAKKGGWRVGSIQPGRFYPEDVPAVWAKRYGNCAQRYYEGSVIETLEDQEAWIKKFLREVDFEHGALHLLSKLVDRVLSKTWEELVQKAG